MSKQQKIWIGVGVTVVVIIAAILVIASIRNQSGGSGSSATYQTTTVQVGTLTSTVEGAGTVASTHSVRYWCRLAPR
jgi:multidrug efflux pump subunit AcrA (membrane-fusion protein)